MVKALFIDMDNTLIETQVIYQTAVTRFVDYILSCAPHDPAAVEEVLQQKQLDAFAVNGFAAESLPMAYEQALLHYVPDATAQERGYARQIALDVYATPAAVKPDVEQAIRTLAQHFDLYLVTVGDLGVQQSRVDVLPFKDVFKEIHIVAEKEKHTYERVLTETGLKAHEVVMIGDSLRSDIIPARQAGIAAIHIPADNWHAREGNGHSLPAGALVKNCFKSTAAYLLKTYANDNKPQAPARKLPRNKFGR